MLPTAHHSDRGLPRALCLVALLLSLTACTSGTHSADEDQRGSNSASKEAGEEEGDEEPLSPDAATDDDSVADGSGEDDDVPSDDETEGDGDDENGEDEPSETPAFCKLPFESGNCLAYIEVWAYETSKQACVRQVYGGCGGNENRFATRKECEQSCGISEGEPTTCPANTKRAEVCLACGLAGGCAETGIVCALKCDEPNDCKGGNEYPTTCVEGICQIYGCI
jgi:hypothetical protein